MHVRCTSPNSMTNSFFSLNAAEWLSRMDHLRGADNLGEAGNFGIHVALARTHNASERRPTCAERFNGCATLPDSYRELSVLWFYYVHQKSICRNNPTGLRNNIYSACCLRGVC